MTIYLDGYSELSSGVRDPVKVAVDDVGAIGSTIYFYGYRLLPSGVRHKRRIAAADIASQDSDVYIYAYSEDEHGVRHQTEVLASGIGSGLIVLSNSSIEEDESIGAPIGTLSVLNGSGVYDFSITSDLDNKFDLDGDALVIDAALDYETKTSHSVTIEADNGIHTPISRTFTIQVINVDEAPPPGGPLGDFSAAANSMYVALLEDF